MNPGIPIGMMNFDRASTRHDEYERWLIDVKKYHPLSAKMIVVELQEYTGRDQFDRSETVAPDGSY